MHRVRHKPFNLFVYGTLMSPTAFRAVTGWEMVDDPDHADGKTLFHARRAVLNGYNKVSPDNTYKYALPEPHGRIRGLLIGPMPWEALAKLRQYEGRNYVRRWVKVQTGEGTERAVVFVGNLKQLSHSFGYRFSDPLKQEILMEERIDKALKETEQEQLHTNRRTTRRAMGELHGRTIRDLMRRHFEAGGISNYAIRQSIKDEPLRDFGDITAEPEAQALASNYLAMVIRQVIFNQFEEHIRHDFRYELDHMPHTGTYYDRTVSSLVALRLLNRSDKLLKMLVRDCLKDLSFEKDRLIDFIQWAIVASDSIYDAARGRKELEYVSGHMGYGKIPMGAELEFSNIGHGVIRDPQGSSACDKEYDGFYYFREFGLDILTWKLGGHVDDHHHKSSSDRRRGFFEVALGNLSIEANISKPITDDPWLLNQFIHEARRFFHIAPHSVHLSLQLKRQYKPARNRLLPLPAHKCLFVLGGDPVRRDNGRVQIDRLCGEEIISHKPVPHMMFSEISKRRSQESNELYPQIRGPGDGTYVQQFRFTRLSPLLNYEVLILALKGIQLSLRPGTFLTGEQYQNSVKHRQRFHDLVDWGHDPEPISPTEVDSFCQYIHDGLDCEHRGKPIHSQAYINWALDRVRSTLEEFNEMSRHKPGATPPGVIFEPEAADVASPSRPSR